LATLRQGSQARLVTAMIVREDSMTLYGFPDTDTRDLFLTLLSVSGVGPRLAMATLAVHDAATLRQALHDGDVAALTRVPGIGKRGAERMVLELRDKMVPAGAVAGSLAVNGHAVRSPVVEALVGLGFAAKQAEEATTKVLAADHDATTSSALRAALSLLGTAR
jgi:Holliday junction DNA helicase RuvA